MKRFIVFLSRKNIIVRKLLRFIRYWYYKIEFLKYSKNTINSKMIIFESFSGRFYSDSPRAIYEYMISNEEYKDYKFIWAFRSPVEKEKYFNNNNTYLVKYNSNEYLKYYSICKYWVSNSRIPDWISKKSRQVYIQTWHGTPLKKLGYDITVSGKNAMNTKEELKSKYSLDAKRYTYMISPSKYTTEKYISAFGLKKFKKEKIILETGYPRNDFLFSYKNEDIKEIKKNLNINSNKKIILYAPTWRDNEYACESGYVYDLNMDFDALKEKLSDKYIILFRSHAFITNSFDFNKYKDFVYDVSKYEDIRDLYVISDILITDYSSVFFDFANLKRPILFYMYDYELYKNEIRDFYIDIKELPGPICKNQNDLIKNIEKISKYDTIYSTKYVKFNKKFNYLDSQESSRNVVERCIK